MNQPAELATDPRRPISHSQARKGVRPLRCGSAYLRYGRGIDKLAWLWDESRWPVDVGPDYRRWLNRQLRGLPPYLVTLTCEAKVISMYKTHPRCLPANRLHNLITAVLAPTAGLATLVIVLIATGSGILSFIAFSVAGFSTGASALFIRCINCGRGVGCYSMLGVKVMSGYAPRQCVHCGYDHHTSRSGLEPREQDRSNSVSGR